MKTLKHFFEIYKPKAKDEQDFVDKHVVIKHKDRNGNGDDVFNGKVKPVDRKKTRLGYDPGDDEKVYEEVEDLDESSHDHYMKGYNAFKSGKHRKHNPFTEGSQAAHHWAQGWEHASDNKAPSKFVNVKEDVDQIDELSRATVGRYSMKAKSIADNEGGKDRSKGRELAGRKKWGGTMSGVKPARVPATNEEVEDLDELSRGTLASYVKKAGGRGLDSAGAHGMDYGVKLAGNDFSKSSRDKSLKKAVNRATGVERAADRLAKEEVEIDEAVSVSHDRYLRSHGKKASGSGGWIFTHKKSGNIDLGDDKSSHIGKGKFSDAAKSAKEWAKKHGHTTIYVAEDFNEDVVRDAILEMAEIEGLDLTEEELNTLVYSLIEDVENLDEKKLGTSTATNPFVTYHPDKPNKIKVFKTYTGAKLHADKLGHKVASREYWADNIKEDVEELDELSKGTLKNYVKKAAYKTAYHTAQQMAARDPGNMEYHGKKAVNKVAGISRAVDKLTKEDVINRAIEKYGLVDEANLPTPAERLVSKLDGLSESHIHALLGLFDSLNEDNQMKMLATADTHEGVLSLLDFAIANRGE